MNDKIFRKESIERISSPEQLTDYIHVTSPAGWMLLGAIIVLLAGICVWGIFGRLDTALTVAAQSRDGSLGGERPAEGGGAAPLPRGPAQQHPRAGAARGCYLCCDQLFIASAKCRLSWLVNSSAAL